MRAEQTTRARESLFTSTRPTSDVRSRRGVLLRGRDLRDRARSSRHALSNSRNRAADGIMLNDNDDNCHLSTSERRA